MARIFSILAGLSLLALIANLVLGLGTGDMEGETRKVWESAKKLQRAEGSYLSDEPQRLAARRELDEVRQAYRPSLSKLRRHIWVGVLASLLTLLVNSVAITYFLGTARWCREVVETYDLDRQPARTSLQYKRQVFFLAFGSMVVILAIVILGALADPTRNPQDELSYVGRWRLAHFSLAVLGVAWIGLAYWWQVQRITANSQIIQSIMQQVEQIAPESTKESTA